MSLLLGVLTPSDIPLYDICMPPCLTRPSVVESAQRLSCILRVLELRHIISI